MKLYFVRHGESEANVASIFSNRGFQHPLTAAGIAQAQYLAQELGALSFARLYSSPLQRAVQTAEILAATTGLSVEVTPALNEGDMGIYENTSDPAGWDELERVWDDWCTHGKWESKVPGGESLLDMRARFEPFLHQILAEERQSDDSLLFVAHGALYTAILPLVLQNIDHSTSRALGVTNAGYILAETRGDSLHCLSWCGTAFEES